jgi:hypothetical protein
MVEDLLVQWVSCSGAEGWETKLGEEERQKVYGTEYSLSLSLSLSL